MAEFETTRSISGARASQIDEGLRAHMNKVYGTMSVGMIITALAAWAISGLATTTDPALAVGQMQNGTMLTGLGATIYTLAFTLGDYVCASSNDFRLWCGHEKINSTSGTAFFLRFCDAYWCFTQLNLHILYHIFNHPNILGNSNRFCRLIALGLHYQERYFRMGFIPYHGCYWPNCGNDYKYFYWLRHDDDDHFNAGSSHICGPDSIRYTKY